MHTDQVSSYLWDTFPTPKIWYLATLISSGLFLKYIWWQRTGSFKSSWAAWVSLGMLDWTNAAHSISNMDLWVCWIMQNTAFWSFLPGGCEWEILVRGNCVFILCCSVFVFQRPSKHVADFSLMSQCFFFVIQLWTGLGTSGCIASYQNTASQIVNSPYFK